MADKTVEGYLLAAMALIPVGIGMIQNAIGPEAYIDKLIGLVLVIIGLVAVFLRGNKKQKNVSKYVNKKVSEVKVNE